MCVCVGSTHERILSKLFHQFRKNTVAGDDKAGGVFPAREGLIFHVLMLFLDLEREAKN